MELSELNLSVRAYNAVMRAGIKDVAELHSRFQKDAEQLQKDIGSKNLMEVRGALLSVDDTAVDVYSMVDDETAAFLRNATAKIANSFADVGAVLAEAQERLAKHGFGENNGVFEKWYTSLGMKKFTVYTFIRIHTFRNETLRSCEFRTNGNALEIFDNLPKMLQADISSPSAPAEAVSAVLSGDITTHKAFVEMKKQLEELNKENAELEEQRDSLLEELQEERSKPQATVITDPKQSEEYKAVAAELKEANETIGHYDNALNKLQESVKSMKVQLGLSCPGLSLIVIPIDVLGEIKSELSGKTWRKLEKYIRFEGGRK